MPSYIDSSEDKAALDAILDRCKAANLRVSASTILKDIAGYAIEIRHSGFRASDRGIHFPSEIQDLTEVPFERIALLEDLEGIYDTATKTVEVTIAGNNSLHFIPKDDLFGKDQTELVIEPPVTGKPVIRIGKASMAHEVFCHGKSYSATTLTLTNVIGASAAEVEKTARRYAVPVFLEIEKRRGVSLRLRRLVKKSMRSSKPYQRPEERTPLEPLTLPYPTATCDIIPANLLMLAQGFIHNPSLRFLFAYQALEFFFIRSNRAEALALIAKIAGDKTFDATDPDHATRLLKSIKQQWVNPAREEREQLTTMLKASVGGAWLLALLVGDKELKDHISKANAATDVVVGVKVPEDQIVAECAKRLYSIRNAVVHAKEDESGTRKIVFLETVEEHEIDLDCELLVFLVKEVLKKHQHPFA